VMRSSTIVLFAAITTIKIPTIIFDGRRHDGLVSVDGLQ
jgi:hypothetical protein